MMLVLVYVLLCSLSIMSLTFTLTLCLFGRRRARTRAISEDNHIDTTCNMAYSAHSSPNHLDINVSPSSIHNQGIAPLDDLEYEYISIDSLFITNGARSLSLPSRSIATVNSRRSPTVFADMRITPGATGSVRQLQTNERKAEFEDIYQLLKQIKSDKDRNKPATTNGPPQERNKPVTTEGPPESRQERDKPVTTNGPPQERNKPRTTEGPLQSRQERNKPVMTDACSRSTLNQNVNACAVMISKWVGDAIVTDGIYDGHIFLNGYPFLDSKSDFSHDSLVCDVMRPKQGEAPLTVVDLSHCTIGSLQQLARDTDYFGFPCVLSSETQLLAGFIARKDILSSLDLVREHHDEGICDASRVFFLDSAHRLSHAALDAETPSVNIRGIMDPSPFQISDQTTMVTVVEMFRKLGLRQLLVSYNGRLLGIVTKKDVLTHIAEVEHKNPQYLHH